MAQNFMAEPFWDEQSRWSWPHTLKHAWNEAVNRVAEHLVTRQVRSREDARISAGQWLEMAVGAMTEYNVGKAKRDAVEQIASTYATSTDIDWTMAVHAKLLADV